MFHSSAKPKQLSAKELEQICKLKSNIVNIDADIAYQQKLTANSYSKIGNYRHVVLIASDFPTRSYDRNNVISEDTELLSALWYQIISQKLDKLKLERKELVTQLQKYVPDFE